MVTGSLGTPTQYTSDAMPLHNELARVVRSGGDSPERRGIPTTSSIGTLGAFGT